MKKFDLLIGTAFWGWTIEKAKTFRILEVAYELGIRKVDTATNYPINGIRDDWRKAENWLLEFIETHGISDLEILMKIGSISNEKSPETNLSKSFVLMMGDEYQRLFGKNLHTIMVHWDNRDDEKEIGETVEALALLAKNYHLNLGLSGIKNPSSYINPLQRHGVKTAVQAKHNVFQSDVEKYESLDQYIEHFFVYGINAGGVKLDQTYSESSTFLTRGGKRGQFAKQLGVLQAQMPTFNTATVRPPIKTMNHLGLIHAFNHPKISGAIVGANHEGQLKETVDFCRNLGVFDYSDISEFVFKKLIAL